MGEALRAGYARLVLAATHDTNEANEANGASQANEPARAASTDCMRCWILILLASACAGSPSRAERRLAGVNHEHTLVHMPGAANGPREFWLGKFEVTQAQFADFVQATGYDGREAPSSKATEPFLADWRDRTPPAGQERHPACQINWHHARAFCRWLSTVTGEVVRLPRDAEWEWAVRGADGRAYPWGDAWEPQRCNWGDGGTVDGYPASAPVGSFPMGASPAGVQDLAGNIWEWTEEGNLRGGPWCMGAETLRADRVAREDPLRADDKFGLRIVVEVR
jgi:hypothetical protein